MNRRQHPLPLLLFLMVIGCGLCLNTGCRSEEGESAEPAQNEEPETTVFSVCKDALLQAMIRGDLPPASLTTSCQMPRLLQRNIEALDKKLDESDLEAFSERLAESVTLMERACPDYEAVFENVVKESPDNRKELMIGGCHLDRIGLATDEEMIAHDGMRVLVGAMTYQWMVDHKVENARPAIRKWIGM